VVDLIFYKIIFITKISKENFALVPKRHTKIDDDYRILNELMRFLRPKYDIVNTEGH